MAFFISRKFCAIDSTSVPTVSTTAAYEGYSSLNDDLLLSTKPTAPAFISCSFCRLLHAITSHSHARKIWIAKCASGPAPVTTTTFLSPTVPPALVALSWMPAFISCGRSERP